MATPHLPPTLVLLLSGILMQVQGSLREVDGIVGDSALLPVPDNHHLVEVRWKCGPEKVLLGDSIGREFEPFNLGNTNYGQLIQRLNMYNETTLRISSLRKGDGGLYKACVQLSDGTSQDHTFLVNVFGIEMQGQESLNEVNGIVGGSALLPVSVPHNHHVLEMRWKCGPENMLLGDSKSREFVPSNRSSANYGQLIPRLDMYNETTLRIRNLTMGDIGVYKVDVLLSDETSQDHTFLANVYGMMQMQGAPREVNRTVGGSALLCVSVPHDRHVVEVRWKCGPTKVRLGDSKGGKFVPFNRSITNYSQLIQRMDIGNETTLNIAGLSNVDSNIYIAEVQFSDGTSQDQEFQLNVYEAPPDYRPVYAAISILSIAVLVGIGLWIWKKKKEGKRTDGQSTVRYTRGSTKVIKAPNGNHQGQNYCENSPETNSEAERGVLTSEL